MNKNIVGLAIILLLFTEFTFSIDFKYEQKIGRKFRFKNQVVLDIYQNNNFISSNDEMNKVILEIIAKTNEIATFQGKFINFKREKAVDSYQLKTEFSGNYSQNERGVMIVRPSDIIPSTRSIPTFPAYSINIGDTWKARGEEVMENIFNNGLIYKIIVNVNYQYLSNLIISNKTLAVISVNYDIEYNPYDNSSLVSISGNTHNLFYWDIENSAPYFYSEELKILYTSRLGDNVLYQGNAASIMEEITDITNVEKANLMTEISNQVSSSTNGFTVHETNDGIIVNLGNILFDVNLYNIKKEYEEKLDNLAKVLVNHPALDIVVSGHTDNSGTNPFNTILSENRARAISDYLVSKGIAMSRISYLGYGPTRPIADNSTAKGRALNRRVEVKIITKE